MIFRFITSGSIGAITNLGILYLLTDVAHVWYLISATVAFIISQIISFIMQKLWTFQETARDTIKRQITLYVSLGIFNVAVNTLLVYLLVDHAGVYHVFAQAISSILIAVYSYFVYSQIFRKNGATVL